MIHFVPVPVPVLPELAKAVNGNPLDYIPICILILIPPLLIGFGLRVGGWVYQQIKLMVNALPPESNEKPKREQSVSFFDQPDEEPDYVVGFGDDGELIYASEKPNRKNDEVE